MAALTAARLNAHIATVRDGLRDRFEDPKLGRDEAGLADFDANLDLDFETHFKFQQTQAAAHAMGTLTTEAAQIVFVALGNSLSSSNGGWSAGTDIATKCSITMLMGELLSAQIKARRVA